MADPLEPRDTLAGYQGIWPTFVGAATPWYSESVTVLGDLPTAVRYYPYNFLEAYFLLLPGWHALQELRLPRYPLPAQQVGLEVPSL
jgi:hypothetical protein